MKEKKRATIYPDKELLKKLKQEADDQDRSLNNLIVLILKEWGKKKDG